MFRRLTNIVFLACLAVLPLAQARAASRLSVVLVNAATGKVIASQAPDAMRHPASLTKMMTLYLAFDALDGGRLDDGDSVPISRHAARQPPSKAGIAAGRSISVRTALRLIAVHSANDVAVALAEKLAGTEKSFVLLMNEKARELGMLHTHFANATGLTDPANLTTARDMATLSIALLRRHPREYALFDTRSLRWQGRRLANHNHLLGKVTGVDGIKTGYTADAGYNIAASAKRRGTRVVAVVLGESSIAARDQRVTRLMSLGFTRGEAPDDIGDQG